MAESSPSLSNKKHMNSFEMEPSISTPSQQEEAKRKKNESNSTREKNNETDSTRKKKPRKKMYRPKVIGEGRRTKGSNKQVNPGVVPKPRIRKYVAPKTPRQKKKSEKSSKLLEDEDGNQLNAIISCTNLVLVENALAVEAKSKEDDRGNAIDSCKDLVLVENELGSEKAFGEVGAIEAKEAEGLCGSFGRPKECKRKRSSRRRMHTNTTGRKPYGLSFSREEGWGSRNKLQLFFFSQRKRTPMVRRCNLASPLVLPVRNQFPRTIHEDAAKSKKTENFKGSDIAPIVGWQLKRSRNYKPSQDSSNCSSRDDDKGTKIEELGIGTPITDVNKEETPTKGSSHTTQANGRDRAVGTDITNVNKEETLSKGSAQPSLSQDNGRDASIRTAIIDVNKEETITQGLAQTSLWQDNGRDTCIGTVITYVNKEVTKGSAQTSLSQANGTDGKHNVQQTMKWLDISHFLTNSWFVSGRSEKNPLEKGLSIPIPRIGFHNVGSGGNLKRQQDFTLSASPSGSANKLRPTLSLLLWNKSEVMRNNHEHAMLTSETRANNEGVVGEETDSFCKSLLVPYTKQIIPYARKEGKKNRHNPKSGIQGAIIPYAKSVHETQGAIVPHSKSLNSTKKKDLNRVYLDARDITVWKVLFENGNEEIDNEWWENERKVFRGRINAFNAIMHLILSDRRFSPWKGSVVDSVVGVFLTQNVSDHLSSSAYMSLAATFPLPQPENYQAEEIFCIQQEGFLRCESKWNHGNMMEDNKVKVDPQEAKELMSNHPEEMEIEKSQIQNQEIQHNGDLNGKGCLCSEYNEQIKNGKQKTTEIYNNSGSQLFGDIGNSSQKLYFDIEKVQSEENVIQAKEAQKHLENKSSIDLNDEKETNSSKGKAKKSKMKPEVDWNNLREKWDSLRREHCMKPRSEDHMDSVDWEAVRFAEPNKIAVAIKERGQHNIIAGRIKDFLERTARLHGCIDLEWLRHAPSEDVKKYLLEIDGLGLKSVECIRLLALQQIAFPVDINVGRIAVRLGWVPLEPLPEEVQIHLLETFPMMDSIQKYLWPRLSMLDHSTLYELHYQLITFGKVFCTKRKPNCNACPLRADCRHYASAYASARLALPGPGLSEKGIVSTMDRDKTFEGTTQVMNPSPVLHIDANALTGEGSQTNNCEPIIEEPPSPEPTYDESQLTDIEDLCEYDSDDIPIIRLSSGQCTTTSLNSMDDIITRALVPLHPKVASIPIRKLKHIERLRTEHQVYELPDSHPLLSKLEPRELNDRCPYLLCIFSPGETVDSSEPLNTRCRYKEIGELCANGSCSSCNIVREQTSGTVRGTILVPCRTANRGRFPLNGTYFQVNEVFADDETSKNPIYVPREWIWDLPRRITYFGTSTTTIFRGLSMNEIQYCFQKGFICVRGFDRRTRTPKQLAEWLHRPTTIKAKANKNVNKKQPYVSNPLQKL